MPDSIAISPIGPFTATVTPPGSKSLTNRALLLAALARGESVLSGVLFSNDTRVMMTALERLGFALRIDDDEKVVVVEGEAGRVPNDEAELHLGNAGTAYRFLTAACCLGDGLYTLDGVKRMRHRPIGELVDALAEIGGRIEYDGEVGFPPLRIDAQGLLGGEVKMKPTLSSQYLSALLHVGPYCDNGLTLRFDGPVTSRPYVEMTLSVMKAFGVEAEVADDFSRIAMEPGAFRGVDYDIEPDASNASYFLAAAAVVPGGKCTVQGLGFRSVQGDAFFAEVLQQMGASVIYEPRSITVMAPPAGERLRGIDIDLNAMPDMAQTLAAVALFAEGGTTIRNIGNLRVKETDRLAALKTELTKLGATGEIDGDDLLIDPPPGGGISPAAIDTYDDHRMAMSFAVAGLAAEGVVINDPQCVDKTFPGFFEELKRFGEGAEGA